MRQGAPSLQRARDVAGGRSDPVPAQQAQHSQQAHQSQQATRVPHVSKAPQSPHVPQSRDVIDLRKKAAISPQLSPRLSPRSTPRISPHSAHRTAAPASSCGDRIVFRSLERLVVLEAALLGIFERLKSGAEDVSLHCREYWGSSASWAHASLGDLHCDELLRAEVRRSGGVELLCIALTSYHCAGDGSGLPLHMRSRLRGLLFRLHENCLIVIDLVRQLWLEQAERSEHTPENVELMSMILRSLQYRHMDKGAHAAALGHNNDTTSRLVHQLCVAGPHRGGPDIPLLSAVRVALAAAEVEGWCPHAMRRVVLAPHLRFEASPGPDPYARWGSADGGASGPSMAFVPLPPRLPDVDAGYYLPPQDALTKYTLVLDLDETLVHSTFVDGDCSVAVRPGLEAFLHIVGALGFEVVVFTAALQDYADHVIGLIDNERVIKYRLCRQHTLPLGSVYLKDLDRLGRDLESVVMVDDLWQSFARHPNNGIQISAWRDDRNDTALTELSTWLTQLVTSSPCSVPDFLAKHRTHIAVSAGLGQHDPPPANLVPSVERLIPDKLLEDGLGSTVSTWACLGGESEDRCSTAPTERELMSEQADSVVDYEVIGFHATAAFELGGVPSLLSSSLPLPRSVPSSPRITSSPRRPSAALGARGSHALADRAPSPFVYQPSAGSRPASPRLSSPQSAEPFRTLEKSSRPGSPLGVRPPAPSNSDSDGLFAYREQHREKLRQLCDECAVNMQRLTKDLRAPRPGSLGVRAGSAQAPRHSETSR